ncbi:MAG: hypothetical protein ACRCUQ_02145 [Alphaproteobacteria bacterium]
MKVIYAATLLVLTGCHSPKIVTDYDDFKKSDVCRLESHLIRNEWGRPTFITLEKEQGNKIKAIFTSRIIGYKHDGFSSNSRIKFQLISNTQPDEELIFKGTVIPTTYHSLGHYNKTTIKSSSVIFYLSESQLRQIIATQEVKFFVPSGKDPLEGELDINDRDAFTLFLNQCCQKKGEKK